MPVVSKKKRTFFLFFGKLLWVSIRSIDTKITLDMALCEKTSANKVLYKNPFFVSFYSLHVDGHSLKCSVLFCEVHHICKIFAN